MGIKDIQEATNADIGKIENTFSARLAEASGGYTALLCETCKRAGVELGPTPGPDAEGPSRPRPGK